MMTLKTLSSMVVASLLLLTGCTDKKKENSVTSVIEVPTEHSWDDIKNHSIPDWFHDAKFGIFIHWGVYAVPAYTTRRLCGVVS